MGFALVPTFLLTEKNRSPTLNINLYVFMVNFVQKTLNKAWRWSLCIICILCVGASAAYAQKRITGRVSDATGEPLAGATITVSGTTRGVIADDEGRYSIEANATDKLVFAYLGMQSQTITAGTQTRIDVVLQEQTSELEEVTVVAFAKQKKNSVIASITTVNPSELKVPSSNLTTALAGRIAGLISYQRTGEPGADNADFFIRGVTTFGTGKKDPLILIDGVEMTTDDLARLTVDDLSSFSIMKDANATALYGARGANGVILVSTKEGKEGTIKVQLRMEGSYSTPTRTMDYADPVTYMKLHNEAISTRTPMATPRYSNEKIFNTERGLDPVRYPAVDWQDMLFSNHTFNQRYNLNVNGGGKIARYYIAAAYNRDNGIIKMDKRNNFNNNIAINRYVLRSNINVNLTQTTEAIVRLQGSFDDYSGPLDGGADLYSKALNANPALFPAYYPADKANQATRHILFGNYGDATYMNPYAEMVKGYKTQDRSNMAAQFELKQNLDFITEGLSARGLFNVNRYSLLEFRNGYQPYFYALAEDPREYLLLPLNDATATEAVTQLSNSYALTNSMYFEAALSYQRTFNEKHDVSGLLVYTLREQKSGNVSSLIDALPYRNIGLAGRLTYGYDQRYFLEGNFGYNGSERFAEHERFGFFPSIGVGWLVSNEEFMQPYSQIISKLKLKGTYGLVGNDDIGTGRFFYLSNVDQNGRVYSFGYNFNYTGVKSGGGVQILKYADPDITWEISRKTNIGLELNLLKSIEFQLDWFYEKRTNILQERLDIPVTMGLQQKLYANIGEASGKGVDMSLDVNKSFSKDIWVVVRGNFTYATSRYDVYEEPDYTDSPWRSRVGQNVSQQWGYVAERLFLDDEEIRNSPHQGDGEYAAGDLKFKDINGDYQIDESDMVPIGFPTTPEINYGFGLTFGYRNFDMSAFWQGSARSSFWIDASATAPFVNNRALLQYYADDHWSENNRNIYALWPRLSETTIANNYTTNTWFMRDGSFVRMKNAEIGYSCPEKWLKFARVSSARIYLNGTNLMLLSKFKMWDPEMAGNPVAYPLQRTYNIGINLGF